MPLNAISAVRDFSHSPNDFSQSLSAAWVSSDRMIRDKHLVGSSVRARQWAIMQYLQLTEIIKIKPEKIPDRGIKTIIHVIRSQFTRNEPLPKQRAFRNYTMGSLLAARKLIGTRSRIAIMIQCANTISRWYHPWIQHIIISSPREKSFN